MSKNPKTIRPTKEEKGWFEKLDKLMEDQPKGLTIEHPIIIEIVRADNTEKGVAVRSRKYYAVVPRSKKILSIASKI